MTSSPQGVGRDCLIGSTGFVGSALRRQHDFEGNYTSRNIASIGEGSWDTVVCAAAPGSMFEANIAPESDARKVEALCNDLRKIRTRRFVLISSIAVLENFAGQDDEDSTRFQQVLAYGRNRRALEVFCLEQFEDCLVVRLPALFGPGLRKNFLFDLMNPMPSMLNEARLATLREGLEPSQAAFLDAVYHHDPATGMLKLDRAAYDADPRRGEMDAAVMALGASATQFHNPETTYQYYDIMRLWQDIGIATQARLKLVHLATEPLRADRIHRRLIGRDMPDTGARLHHEDMRTRHAGLWGRQGGYLQDADEVLNSLASFFAAGK
ncbi:NAD-dependent epimerase/dehydratase family protein [Tistrella mobilis]|uniref:NAD-dependent epimerase/dehydratase family protein n=1 Tax=Tistrella mobilis TaxID=171437 RepID=UPI00269BADF1